MTYTVNAKSNSTGNADIEHIHADKTSGSETTTDFTRDINALAEKYTAALKCGEAKIGDVAGDLKYKRKTPAFPKMQSPDRAEITSVRRGIQQVYQLRSDHAAKDLCAGIVCATATAWDSWERGDRTMPAASWELFLIKAPQILDESSELHKLWWPHIQELQKKRNSKSIEAQEKARVRAQIRKKLRAEGVL